MSELSKELEGKMTSDDKSERIDAIKYGSPSMLEQLMADEDKEVAAMAKKVYDQSKVDVLDYEEKKDKAKLKYEKAKKRNVFAIVGISISAFVFILTLILFVAYVIGTITTTIIVVLSLVSLIACVYLKESKFTPRVHQSHFEYKQAEYVYETAKSYRANLMTHLK